MVFVVFCATDMMGTKLNYELEFPAQPTVSELIRHIESVFTEENRFRKVSSQYKVARLNIVDEATEDWVEVIAQAQLKSFCQVYAFQPHSTQLTESQGHIPAATRPLHLSTAAASAPALPPATPLPATASYGAPALLHHASAPALHQTVGSVGAVPAAAYAVAATPGLQRSGSAGGAGLAASAAAAAAAAGAASVQPLASASAVLPASIPGVAQVRLLPQDAAHDEKVRACFEGLDANTNRVIELDEFKRGFQMFGMDFSLATMDDLFSKGDVDRDGVISFAEWQRFCELYPTMLDSLYYRLKSHWEIVAGKNELDALTGLVAQLQDQEFAAKAAFDQAQLDADQADRLVGDQDRNAAEAASRARAAEEQARETARDIERAAQIKAERERQVAAERERERQAALAGQHTARELDAAQRKMQQVAAATSEAEAAERRAQQALADAQRELQRLRAVSDQTAHEVAAAADRHNRTAAENDGRGLAEAVALLNQAEHDLAAGEARRREAEAQAAAVAASAADVARQQEEALRRAAAARGAQEPARQRWLAAQQEVERQVGIVNEKEGELAQEIAQKRMLHAQEKGLVEEEVRLREQRECLEEKEGALRNAHTSFFKGPVGTVAVAAAAAASARY